MYKLKLIAFHKFSACKVQYIWGINLFFILVMGIFLSACQNSFGNKTPTPTIDVDLLDKSWLTGDPCSPPCWYGLEPDVSDEQQVLSVLESLPFVNPNSIEESIVGFGDVISEEPYNATAIQASKYYGSGIRLLIGKGVVKRISFGLDYEITIGEIVDQIGIPDRVQMLPVTFANSCDVEIYWIEKQLINSYRISGSNWLEKCTLIEEGSKIDRNTMISTVDIIYRDWMIVMLNPDNAVPWPGFVE